MKKNRMQKLALAGAFAAMALSHSAHAAFDAATVVDQIEAAGTALGTVLGAVVVIWGVFILVKLIRKGIAKL